MSEKKETRAAITNRKVVFLQDVDGRSKVARRYRDLVREFSDEVGGNPSGPQLTLIQRAAGLAVKCELMEVELAQSGDVHVLDYKKWCTVWARLCIGWVYRKVRAAKM